jgi:hypothetical protein
MAENTTNHDEVTPSNSSHKRKSSEKMATPSPDTLYKVKGGGYEETFESKEAAYGQAEILKKRGIKNKDAVNVTVSAQAGTEKPKVIRNIKIDESFFD